MHATQLLDNHLRTHCQATHQWRMDAVISAVNALLCGRVLTVTGLGRSMLGDIAPKHQIKKADRLIGNPHLHSERDSFYRALILLTIGKVKRPVIIVDWSDITADSAIQKLRAASAVGGRALTLYEEVHPQSKSGNRRVHTQFLRKLERLLPDKCRPIIVTDAGFHNPWFKAVQALGWDFVGRVGGHIMIKARQGNNDWLRVERVFENATTRAKYYGEVELVRKNPLSCHAYTLKRKPTGRIEKTRFGRKSGKQHTLKNSHRERTPWLLVTSLDGGNAVKKIVIGLYKARMQVEEAFRDLKSHRYGFGFRYCMTRNKHRLENLLLIGALATLAAWLVGKVAELKNWHRQYQANTVRNRSVISTVYLGCAIIGSRLMKPTHSDFKLAIRELWTSRYTDGLLA